MIGFGDAGIAEGAVLASGRLGDVASAACLGRSVEDVVVGVLMWVSGLGAEIMSIVGDGEIGEYVWQGDEYWRR